MYSALKDIAEFLAKDALSTAILAKVPEAVMRNTNVGSDVLVYCQKPEDKSIRPFKLIKIHEKVLQVDVRISLMQVSVDKIRYISNGQTNED